jgi:hypothetical protein
MKTSDILATGQFKCLAGDPETDLEVTGCYISDLLSWVMGHSGRGDAWITIMSHLNIIAVAALKEFSCIIVSEGGALDDNAAAKANEDGILVLGTPLPTFEAAKLLAGLGL